MGGAEETMDPLILTTTDWGGEKEGGCRGRGDAGV